jgi:AraC-like DNA-binding protein
MDVRLIRLQTAIAFSRPGAPFLAWSNDFHSDTPFRSDHVEVIAIVSGEGRRTVASADRTSRSDRLVPGQMHLFRPKDVHTFEGVGRRGMSAMGVAFPLASWERFAMAAELDRALFSAPDPPMIGFDPDDPEALRPFHRILDRGGGTALDLVEFLAAVIPRFVRAVPPEHGQAPDWLWSAISAMHDEANLKAGAARFGELSHVSPSHLWRCTRRYFGLSPSELILDLQLRHAATLLTSTDERISVIGERCGFTSASHFSKAFRNTHLLSPREYRIRSRA